ncbi:MAG: hypothetical protein JSS58_05000 [Proteobacteria bacterium]|nr:hypothetical protein [Pseudomonadota bacterium]
MTIQKFLPPFLFACMLTAAQAQTPTASTATPAVFDTPTAASAPAAPTYTAEHLAAAERIVYAMALPERFILPSKAMIKLSEERDADNAALMETVFNSYLEKKYTADKLTPYFASRFDLGTCRQIATFWEGPVGKKLVKAQINILNGGEPKPIMYTRKEKAILKQFETSPAGQAMLAALPDIEETFADYTSDTQKKMREVFLRELERHLKSKAAASATSAASSAPAQ